MDMTFDTNFDAIQSKLLATLGGDDLENDSEATDGRLPTSPIGKRTALRKRLHEVFLIYCSWGRTSSGSRLTNHNYMKLLRDADVVKSSSSHVLDCIFTKHARDRTLTFRDFEHALIDIAARGQIFVDDLYKSISDLPGPTINTRLTNNTFAWDGADVRPISTPVTDSWVNRNPRPPLPEHDTTRILLKGVGLALAELAKLTNCADDGELQSRSASADRLRSVARQLENLAVQLDTSSI